MEACSSSIFFSDFFLDFLFLSLTGFSFLAGFVLCREVIPVCLGKTGEAIDLIGEPGLGDGCGLTCWREARGVVGEARGVSGEARGRGGVVRGDDCCGSGETAVVGGAVVGEATEEPKADRERF